ncbi:DUF2075 domain-containing protein [Corynebacterium sp. CCUG 71335]|uniref:DUF2075 domain-containing protein n=1 Tax=Corynebacterium sp. CCUG 71335 TaxID=2823892 RepID=UPI00210EA563|nr:DUF2075 domain-containing protein [Corynebacterium sp. CCUG 71335]MCQ4620933.1 DUF2075 domain-containing protein [Corynebacterium sp. CCUG 71335]
MDDFPTPYIRRVRYSDDFKELLESSYGDLNEEERAEWVTHQLNFPTVYVVRSSRETPGGLRFSVYVGETNDITKRTRQHLYHDSKNRPDWAEFKQANEVEMYVIGHPYFNKSLTLDIENRFLHYLEACRGVERHNNRRTNEQRQYYTLDHLDPVFNAVWDELREMEPELFDPRDQIEQSAIFKASPFHKLNEQQLAAQNEIFAAVNTALNRKDEVQGPEEHKLIIVSGEAGSGKTVLISSVFNGLISGVRDEDERFEHLTSGPDGEGTGIDAYLVSGHKNEGGQLQVYEEILKKLNIPKSRAGDETRVRVYGPTSFINSFSPEDPVDVVLIDEAHLLITQKSMSYTETVPQIEAILNRAKVVVAVYDTKQSLERTQYWETPLNEHFGHRVAAEIEMTNQLRLNADDAILDWIRNFIDNRTIGEIPNDSRGYELKIFENPADLANAIRQKDSAVENSLARLLATFDWPYSQKGVNKEEEDGRWYVDVHHPEQRLKLPWNLQTKAETQSRRRAYRSAWSESPHTINEVGSTYTIQGFDLNFAGVILGPSIVYRDGYVQINPDGSAHKKATENRTLADGSKKSFGVEFINNELNVLLTRGVQGLYIYAQDEALREALLDAQRERPLIP